jgi:hypothetical protein
MDKFGNKTGGRVKGAVNSKTAEAREICNKFGFDPVEFLVAVAQMDFKKLGYASGTITKMGKGGVVVEEDVITMNHRIEAARVICNKTVPDLKSVEVKGDADGPPVSHTHHIDVREMIKIAREPKK